jgi:hypothetical protein
LASLNLIERLLSRLAIQPGELGFSKHLPTRISILSQGAAASRLSIPTNRAWVHAPLHVGLDAMWVSIIQPVELGLRVTSSWLDINRPLIGSIINQSSLGSTNYSSGGSAICASWLDFQPAELGLHKRSLRLD